MVSARDCRVCHRKPLTPHWLPAPDSGPAPGPESLTGSRACTWRAPISREMCPAWAGSASGSSDCSRRCQLWADGSEGQPTCAIWPRPGGNGREPLTTLSLRAFQATPSSSCCRHPSAEAPGSVAAPQATHNLRHDKHIRNATQRAQPSLRTRCRKNDTMGASSGHAALSAHPRPRSKHQ